MPIKYHIDHDRHLVIASGVGNLAIDDFFNYQRTVWSRSDVARYSEIVDMTLAGSIESPTAATMRNLANLSESMAQVVAVGKTAIVAPQQLVFGLGRMYEAYRKLQEGSAKEVSVFRTLAEAAAFLGIDLPISKPDGEGA